MICFQRTVAISRGIYAEAMAWARALANYMNENVTGPDIRVLTPAFA